MLVMNQIGGKTASQIFLADLQDIGNRVLQLLQHLLLPPISLWNKFLCAAKSEIALWQQERYIKTHREKIRKSREALGNRAKTVIKKDRKEQAELHFTKWRR